MKKIVECPYYKRKVDHEYCKKCKYHRPYGEDMVDCAAENVIIEVKYERENIL